MGIDTVQYRGTMRKDLKQLYKTYQKLITEGPHMEVERFSCKGSWLVEDKKISISFFMSAHVGQRGANVQFQDADNSMSREAQCGMRYVCTSLIWKAVSPCSPLTTNQKADQSLSGCGRGTRQIAGRVWSRRADDTPMCTTQS
jgi:hypothetical protein